MDPTIVPKSVQLVEQPIDVTPKQVPILKNVTHEYIEPDASILSQTDMGLAMMQEKEPELYNNET